MPLRSGTAPLPGGFLGIELLGETLGVEAWKALPEDSSETIFWKGCPKPGFGPEILTLIRESEALRELPDEGLVKPILDATRQELPHLVFPWLKGQIHGSRPVGYATSQILGSLREISELVHGIHKCGWIHADIRPENLFWVQDGIKLIDFGLAHRIGEISEHSSNHSPDFLAPEIRKAGYSWQPSADWFALGKTAQRWLNQNSVRNTNRKGKLGVKSTENGPPGFWEWMGQWVHENPSIRPRASQIVNSLFDWEIKWLDRGN